MFIPRTNEILALFHYDSDYMSVPTFYISHRSQNFCLFPSSTLSFLLVKLCFDFLIYGTGAYKSHSNKTILGEFQRKVTF